MKEFTNGIPDESTPDLKKDIEKVEQEYETVKSFIHILKEGYEKDKKNYDEKTKQEQSELSRLETAIKQQNKTIKEIESSLIKCKDEQGKIADKTKADLKLLNEMNQQIKLLKSQQVKQYKPKPVSTRPKKVQNLKKQHRWDSDSSMDLPESKILTEIKQRQKMRNQVKDKVRNPLI